MDKKILVIFDFCETLIDMQTANAFVSYSLNYNRKLSTILNELMRKMLRKMRILRGWRHKKFQLRQIKGINKTGMKEIVKKYYREILSPKEIKVTKDRIVHHKKKGHMIVIVSGGFSEYIREYAKKNGIDKVIATDLEIKNGKYTGKIKGLDCIGINKILKLFESVNINEFDLKNSYAYTDHFSDIPIISLVGNRFFITKKEVPDWTKIMKCKVLKYR